MYEDESNFQKTKYEAMIEDQIRKSIRQMDEKQNEMKEFRKSVEKKENIMINSFHVTEKRLIYQVSNYLEENINNKESIKDLNKQILKAKKQLESVEESNVSNIERLKKVYKEDVALLESEIWSLKAKCVQLNEQQDVIKQELSKSRSTGMIFEEQLEHMGEENSKQQNEIQMLNRTIDEMRSKEVLITQSYNKLKKRCHALSKQYNEVSNQKQIWKKRIQNLEAKIDQLATCVYNPRKLEHLVLNLLAQSQNTDIDDRYKRTL